ARHRLAQDPTDRVREGSTSADAGAVAGRPALSELHVRSGMSRAAASTVPTRCRPHPRAGAMGWRTGGDAPIAGGTVGRRARAVRAWPGRVMLMLACVAPFVALAPGAGRAADCAGDCNGDGKVSIAELTLAVTLTQSWADTCNAVDRNGDHRVTID